MSKTIRQKTSTKHVLILGCGRSGTSIFGELFEQLPNYTYYSEPAFSDLYDFDFSKPIAIKVPKESADFPADLGLSFPLQTLMKLIPNVQIFWQVRHPLDTICSLKVGISRNWGHHPKPPDWEDWLAAPLVKRCAHHWNYLNSVGFQQVVDLATLTRFEEMIRQPKAFAEKISQQVEIDKDGNQQAITAWAKRVQNSNNKDFVEAKTSRPYSTNDHSVRIGRWKENMTAEERKWITPIVQETARMFGYLLS